MKETKFCINCKHSIYANSFYGATYYCNRLNKLSPVTGKPMLEILCDLQRNYPFPEYCGPDGKYYEEKCF